LEGIRGGKIKGSVTACLARGGFPNRLKASSCQQLKLWPKRYCGGRKSPI
jgi:hypothetical protein